MLSVVKVTGGVLSSNMYIINEEGSPFFWIIDIGSFDQLFKILPESAKLKGCFLTHGHFDHISGINSLHEKFPECKIYTSEYGKEQLYSDKKNFSLYHEKSMIFNGKENNIIVLHDGDNVELYDDCFMRVLETPGHCISCLTYITKDHIFTGDSYIPNVPVVTKLPKGDKISAEDSVNKILSLSGNRVVCCGHDVERWVSVF